MNILRIALFGLMFTSASLSQAHTGEATVLTCDATPAGLSDTNAKAIDRALENRLVAALGPKWIDVDTRSSKVKVEPKAMANLVEIASCAAVVDVESSCSMYFDPEFSMTLGIFTSLPRKEPLRRQFDDALKALPEGKKKAAALSCMKLVAAK